MPRILIVDDDASSLRPLAKLLALDGFEVFATDMAQHGLALLGVERFDAVVTDLAMPHVDGIAVVDAARRLQPSARVVVASASPELAAPLLGDAVLVAKPLDYDALLDALGTTKPHPTHTPPDDLVDLHPLLRPLRDLASGFADALLVVDRHARVVIASPSAERVFGVPSSSLLGPVADYPTRFDLREGDVLHPDPIAQRALAGMVVDPIRRTMRRYDVLHDVRTSAAPVRDGTGQIIGAIVIVGELVQRDELAR